MHLRGKLNLCDRGVLENSNEKLSTNIDGLQTLLHNKQIKPNDIQKTSENWQKA